MTMQPANHPSAAPLDLDALERLATETRDAWNIYAAAPHTAAGNDARVDYLAFREDFKSACSPDVILALVAAARRGVEDTERMDWLEDRSLERNIYLGGLEPNSDPAVWWVALKHEGLPTEDAFDGYSLRTALDAARAALPTEDADGE